MSQNNEIPDNKVVPLHNTKSFYEGHIKLYRALLKDPHWKATRLKYRHVFLTIFEHAVYTSWSFSFNGHLITLEPGQFCKSIRQLVDLCNEGIRFKEDHVDKNIVERAVKYFIEIQLLRQEVRHGISVITVTLSERYEQNKLPSETASETKVRQKRDTKEQRQERKERKEEQQQHKSADASVVVFSSFENISHPLFNEKIKKTLTKKYHDREEDVINALRVVFDPVFIPQENHLKSFYAAMKGLWKPKKEINSHISENKEYAKKMEGLEHPYTFVASPMELEIIKGVNGNVECVKYAMDKEDFINKINQIINKKE